MTSSSVWVNLPAAATLIIVLRYLALDFVIRKKAAAYNSKTSLSDPPPPQKKPLESSRVLEISDWKRKVNSPVVECAIDQFTRHLISEMVTDLWYSRITPDKQAPGELIHILNGALGEISSRMRNINLIDLLTRLYFCLFYFILMINSEKLLNAINLKSKIGYLKTSGCLA